MLIRLLAVLEIVLIALGLALTGSGYWRQVYWLANAGILALGAGTAIGGLETMLTRRIGHCKASVMQPACCGLYNGWQ
jgi:hypothetical protein